MVKTFLSVFLLVILGFIIFAESRSMPLFKAVKNFFLIVWKVPNFHGGIVCCVTRLVWNFMALCRSTFISNVEKLLFRFSNFNLDWTKKQNKTIAVFLMLHFFLNLLLKIVRMTSFWQWNNFFCTCRCSASVAWICGKLKFPVQYVMNFNVVDMNIMNVV